MSGLFKKFAIPLLSLTVLLIIPAQVNAFSDVVSYQGRAFSGSSFVAGPRCYPLGFKIARFVAPVGPENAGNPQTTQRIIAGTEGPISSFRNSDPIHVCPDGQAWVENGLFNVLLDLSNFQPYLSSGTYYGVSISFNGAAYSAWQPLSAAAVSLLSNRLAGVGMYTNNVTGSGINGSIAFDSAPGDWVGIYGENAGVNRSRLVLAAGDDNGQDEIRFRSQGWAANGANAPIDYLVSNSNRFDITSGSLISKKGGAYGNGGIMFGNHSLNSNSDGWLYLLDSSWANWNRTGLATNSLSADNQICLRGDCRTTWPATTTSTTLTETDTLQAVTNRGSTTSNNINLGGTLSVGGDTSLGGNIRLNNQKYLSAVDAGGTERTVLYGRYGSNNATYLDGGTGGLYLRTNNDAKTNLFLPTSGGIKINDGPLITTDAAPETNRVLIPNDLRANNLVATNKVYPGNDGNKFLGPGRNGDESLISKSGQWLRVGSTGGIAMWGRNGAETNDTPDVFIRTDGYLAANLGVCLGGVCKSAWPPAASIGADYAWAIRGCYSTSGGCNGDDPNEGCSFGDDGLSTPGYWDTSGGDRRATRITKTYRGHDPARKYLNISFKGPPGSCGGVQVNGTTLSHNFSGQISNVSFDLTKAGVVNQKEYIIRAYKRIAYGEQWDFTVQEADYVFGDYQLKN